MAKTKWPETLSPFFCWFCSHLYCFFRKPHSTINRLSFFFFLVSKQTLDVLWKCTEEGISAVCVTSQKYFFCCCPRTVYFSADFLKNWSRKKEKKKVDFPHFWEVAGQDKAAFYYKIHWWTESCILWYVGYFLLCYFIGKNLMQKNLVVKYTKFRACLNIYQCATTVFVWLYLVKLLLI